MTVLIPHHNRSRLCVWLLVNVRIFKCLVGSGTARKRKYESTNNPMLIQSNATIHAYKIGMLSVSMITTR